MALTLPELIAQYKAQFTAPKIRNKTGLYSITNIDEADCWDALADLLLFLVPNGIVSGLDISLADPNVIIAPGTWKIDGNQYSTTDPTSIPYDQPDMSLSRYDVLYGDVDGVIHLLSGPLGDTAVLPDLPNNVVMIGSLLVTPDGVEIVPPPDSNFVDVITDQVINGIKTFLQSPQVPIAVGDNDAVPLVQLMGISTFDEIIDEEPDYVQPTPPDPGPTVGLINITNQGDEAVTYDDGGTHTLSPAGTYGVNYIVDPSFVPMINFDTDHLYALEPDGVAAADGVYINAAEAAVAIAQYTLGFAQDYITINGNGNLNLFTKNLVITAIDSAVRAAVTQLQVIDVTAGNTVVYDGLADMSAPLKHVTSQLVVGHTYKLLIASTDTNMAIAITAQNLGGALYKTQNLLTGDPDNSFTAPISVALYPAT